MTAWTIDITREGRSFAVLDDPQTRSWNYWEQQYASGVWEPEVLATIGELLAQGGDYLDIGAWVGPTVLWAAGYADHVTAVEPDPIAAGVLLANVGMNVNNVTLWPAAVTNGIDGHVTLRNRSEVSAEDANWGNSASTIIDAQLFLRHVDETLDHVDEVDVPAVDLADVIGVCGDDLRLVKIDIEGGEADLIPRLREAHCPLIISLHLPWIADVSALNDDLQRLGHVTYLDESDHRFPVVLVTP